MGDQALYLLTSIRTRANYAYILLFDQILITPTLQYNFSVKIALTKYLIRSECLIRAQDSGEKFFVRYCI